MAGRPWPRSKERTGHLFRLQNSGGVFRLAERFSSADFRPKSARPHH
jgi:hypothetical protein